MATRWPLAMALGCLASTARAQEAPRWQTLAVAKARSLGGATFEPQPDGTLRVGGPDTDKDRFTLELTGLPANVTALRIDVLPDPALPGNGPGRAHRDFVLTGMEAAFGPKGRKSGRPVALEQASASWSQEGYPPLGAVDGVATTGWAVGPKFDDAHHLVAQLGKEIAAGPGDALYLELLFDHGDHTAFGRFKVSATDARRPVRADGAGDAGDWGEVQPRINHAIDRGVDWLLQQQLLDGSWEIDQGGYRNGGTSLVLYALLKSGVRKGHPAVERALEWLRCGRPVETYTLGCQLMALGALDDPAVEPWMKQLLETLLQNQVVNGAFRYSPTGAGLDLSNTQYGVLGMRAAAKRGIRIAPEAWEKAAQYALSVVDDGGGGAYAPVGFKYNGDAAGIATGSMTSAGAGILAIVDEQLRGKSKISGLGSTARAGGEWLGRNFVVDANPRGDGQWTYYYLYGLERLGALLQTEEFGGHRWYREGARWLVNRQEESGAWPAAGAGALGSTAWALLFLNRATSPSSGKSVAVAKTWGSDDPRQPLSVRASGDSPMTFWISSWGDVETKSWEWPGEQGKGLRVKQVEWFAVGHAAGGEPVAIGKVAKEPIQPCGRERFGAQHAFELPGDYSLFARATIATPAADGGAPVDVEIESPLLAVRVNEVADPRLLEYARDPRQNLLTQQKPSLTASSQRDEWWQPTLAVDGLVSRGWACRDDDAAPRLGIALEKPVRANVVLLTPTRPGREWPWPTRAKVTLNGKGPAFEVALEAPTGDRAMRKSRLVLETPIVVRRIDVEIVERSPPGGERGGCGFAEIELQIDAGAKK